MFLFATLMLTAALQAAPSAKQVPMLAPEATVGHVIKKEAPNYPYEAAAGHISGDVIIEIEISKEGKVTKAKVIKGHPLLIDAAVHAVKQWKYSPFLLNGEPVIVGTTVTIHFAAKT